MNVNQANVFYTAARVRHEVVRYMRHSAAFLHEWNIRRVAWSGGRNLQAYTMEMSRDGTWGGEAEVFAAAQLYGFTINVYETQDLVHRDGTQETVLNQYDYGVGGQHLHLMRVFNNHYNSLYFNQNQPGLPSVAAVLAGCMAIASKK